MHNLQPCVRRALKHPIIENISPNCWQNISYTRIYPIPIYMYIQLFIYSLNVCSIYPIQIYEIQFAAEKIPGPNLPSTIFPGPNLPGPNLPRTIRKNMEIEKKQILKKRSTEPSKNWQQKNPPK